MADQLLDRSKPTGCCWWCHLSALSHCRRGSPEQYPRPNSLLALCKWCSGCPPRRSIPATYADDTTLYSTMSSMETATATCQTFQTGVNKLAQCGATWRIQFEPSKSQAMTISRHRVDWPIPPVAFNRLNVADVDTIKLLGVTFDRHLHYGQHLRTTALRAARRIGFPRKACKVLDDKGRTAAYKGFVRPMLEYCTLVWSGAADGHLRRLDKVQKRALSLLGQGTIVDSSGRLTSGSRPGQAVPSPFCQRSKDEGKLRPKFTKCEKINIFEHATGFRPPVAMAKPKWRQIVLSLTLFSKVTSKEGKPVSCAWSVFIPVKRMGLCNFSPMG